MVELPTHLRGAPMGARTISRAELAVHQRERVISTVIPVFAKRGYQATSVDDLLAAGRVGVGNFYSLFEGKEDCFLAAFESIVVSARVQIGQAVSTTDGWAEKTFLGLRELVSLILADRRSARVVLIEALPAGPEATRRYSTLLDSAAGWLRRGRSLSPEGESLPPTFERFVIAGLAYYLQQRLFTGETLEFEGLFDEICSAVLAPLVDAEELRRLRAVLLEA
jgi:AcrR family transcriptional regulator